MQQLGQAWLPANPQKSWSWGGGVPVAQRLPGAAGCVSMCACLCGVHVGAGLGSWEEQGPRLLAWGL